MPTVPLGPRHPQPAALAELAAELWRVSVEPAVASRLERAGGELLREECAHLGAQVLSLLGESRRRKAYPLQRFRTLDPEMQCYLLAALPRWAKCADSIVPNTTIRAAATS